MTKVLGPSMAHSMSLPFTCLLKLGIATGTRVSRGKCSMLASRSSPRFFSVQAVQENEGPRRLVDIIRIVPQLSRNYFQSPSRRALFGGNRLVRAQTISLCFGALGVNDVIAAVLCVLITEYVTRFYYSRPNVTFPLALLNNFKMGFTYGPSLLMLLSLLVKPWEPFELLAFFSNMLSFNISCSNSLIIF